MVAMQPPWMGWGWRQPRSILPGKCVWLPRGSGGGLDPSGSFYHLHQHCKKCLFSQVIWFCNGSLKPQSMRKCVLFILRSFRCLTTASKKSLSADRLFSQTQAVLTLNLKLMMCTLWHHTSFGRQWQLIYATNASVMWKLETPDIHTHSHKIVVNKEMSCIRQLKLWQQNIFAYYSNQSIFYHLKICLVGFFFLITFYPFNKQHLLILIKDSWGKLVIAPYENKKTI